MAVFKIESTSNLGFVSDIVALSGGGFAALARDAGSGPGQVSVFGVASDGGARRIGTDIALENAGVSLSERSGGEFAVISRVAGPVLTQVTLFSANGKQMDDFVLPENFQVFTSDPLPNFSPVPGEADLWFPRFDGAGFLLERLNSETLRPLETPEVVHVDRPALIFDGGFGVNAGFSGTRGAPVMAVSVTTPDGRLPTYANPVNIFSDREMTTAGNMIVEVGMSQKPASLSKISIGIEVNICEPDTGSIRNVLTEDLGFGLVESRVVEVPGLGFAVLVLVEGGEFGTSGVIDSAEVRFYDLDGTERARSEVTDLVGQRTTASDGSFSFTALVDPQHETLRFLTVWRPKAADGANLASLGTITKLSPTPIDSVTQFQTTGTTYGDYLAGLGAADLLFGEAGNDVLEGFGGADGLDGGAGDDRMAGHAGQDALSGGEGSDLLEGGGGNDFLFGGPGADLLLGGGGADTLRGDADEDTLEGGAGNDTLSGGLGADVIEGGDGVDLLQGDEGDDLLAGQNGNDRLLGGDGNDALGGGAGRDTLIGGAEDDVLFGDDGNDRLNGGGGEDELKGGAGDDVLIGGPAKFDGSDDLQGGEGDDTLAGGSGDDDLFGERGADRLAGNGGDDVLSGGVGSDKLIGGAGSDFLFGNRGSDLLVGGGGADVFLFGNLLDAGSLNRFDRIQDFDPDVDSLNFGFVGEMTRVRKFSDVNVAEFTYNKGTGLMSGDIDGDGEVDFRLKFLNTPDLPDLLL